jgi:hypothetical protein
MKMTELIELTEALEKIGYEIVLEDRPGPLDGLGRPAKCYKRLTVTIQKTEAPEASVSE